MRDLLFPGGIILQGADCESQFMANMQGSGSFLLLMSIWNKQKA